MNYNHPPSRPPQFILLWFFFSSQHHFFIFNTISQKDLQLTPAEITEYVTHLPLSIIQ